MGRRRAHRMEEPTMPDTDELVDDAANGDGAAVQELFARHRDRLRRMVAARIDPRLAARVNPSDVVQEALGDAARALPAFLRERPLPFADWLRQFAWDRLMKLHHHHIGTQRRSVVRERRELTLPDETAHELGARLAASGTSPSQNLIREETIRRVRKAMAALGPDDREILGLRHVEQLSMADVAEQLGIREGTARVRHLRALRRLKERLEDVR